MQYESIFFSVPKGALIDELDDEITQSTEWNYHAIAIQDQTGYYLWGKGVSLKISPSDLIEVIKYPYLTTDSMAFKFHQQINIIRNLSNIGSMHIAK